MTRPGLTPLDDALAELLAHAQPLDGGETVSTFDADGRVLAQDCVSALQVPPQDNSSMDGYAVRSAEVADEGVVMPVSQRIPAGAQPEPLVPGSAARIFTGAQVPPGADAIVMQEDCELVGEQHSMREPAAEQIVRINRVPDPGQWIRRAGEDVTRGAVVLSRGQRLGPADIGLAANIGMDRLKVARRPRVALFSTGDELVMPGAVPPEQMKPGTIYNSNRFFLRALLQRLGCELTDLGVVPDRRDATIEALRMASTDHDLILTSGGVSVGEEDHIKPAVESLGRLNMWQIAMKPGKPFAYGHISRTVRAEPVEALGSPSTSSGRTDFAHFIGLPGNPVSSFVTFVLLVRPFVRKLQGATRIAPAACAMTAHFDWRGDRRREFLRVRRNTEGGLDLFPNQSSGVLTSASWADGLVDNPAGTAIARGDTVRFLPLAELLQ
jgi:molybdopterin molybdotransferase